MRKFIILATVIVALFAAIWNGIQAFMAHQISQLASAGTGFTMTEVRGLHDPTRIGVRITEPRLDLPAASVVMPEASLSVPPFAPMTARLELAPKAMIDLGSGPHELGLTDPRASIRFLVLSGFAPGRAGISIGPLTLDETPLAAGLTVRGRMTALEYDAPQGSRTAYDIDWNLKDLIPAALPPLPGLAGTIRIADPVSIRGKGRVWLDAMPTIKALQTPPTPFPTGIRIDNADLQVKGLTARMVGMLKADANGYASGAIALYTTDAQAMLQTASEAGMIPHAAVMLGRTMIRTVSALPMEGTLYPAPQDGELRLPLTFADGRISLGPIPLGPAPLMRP